MTEEDYKRVSSVDWGEEKADYKGVKLFRELKPHEKAGTNYTHRMVSRDDTCPFLVNKLCFIHGQKGGPFKPTICQQFPYAFTETPSGVYATVSFVSMAVLYNQGTPLVDQVDTIKKKYSDFKMLYPHYRADWSKIQLGVQQPITWDQYMLHEAELMKRICDKSKPLNARLQDCSDYLAEQVKILKQSAASSGAEQAANSATPAPASVALNKYDRHLLSAFHKIYFPRRAYRAMFNVPKFWIGFWLNLSTVFEFTSDFYAIDQLKEFPFPENDPEIEDMFFRWIYSMIFGKKYFGSGFGHLSMVTGFNHLIMAYGLARLHARGLAKMRKAPIVSVIDVVATLKQLETQMGEIMIGPSAATTMELLLQHASRARRFLALG